MGISNKPLHMDSAASNPIVLVVDDDADSREALAVVLVQQGCRILEASNGRQALDLLADHRDGIKLILLDLQMPVMNWWEFLAALSRQAQPAIPRIIVISGQNTPPLSGVAAVLKKPLEVPVLLSLMQQL